MENNKRPDDMARIQTQEQAERFIAEQVEAVKAQVGGKKVLLVDDVISTGESLHALEKLTEKPGGIICGRAAVLAEGDAANRDDIVFLSPLPLIHE